MMPTKRGYKRKALRKVRTTQKGTKSRSVLDTIPTLLGTKTLATQCITAIPRGSGGNDNEREQDDLYLSGIRLRATFRNNENIPLWFHVALINPIDAFPVDSVISNTPFSTEFFFGNVGGNTQQGITPATTLRGIDFGTLPINAGRHNVIWHMRKMLGVRYASATQAFTTGAGIPNYTKLSRWIKINKKISYVNGTDVTCRQPMFLVWWCSQYEEADTTLVPNCMTYQIQAISYFRDTQR